MIITCLLELRKLWYEAIGTVDLLDIKGKKLVIQCVR